MLGTWLWMGLVLLPGTFPNNCDVWQSRVEIEGYSVAYFDRIDAFGAPYRRTSVKGRAHMRFEDA